MKKGFFPCHNNHLMQFISVHISMQKLVRKEKRAKLDEASRYIPPEWLDWAEDELNRGIEGEHILKILVKLGFRPERNPHLMQVLRASRGGSVNDPVRPRKLDFMEAVRQANETEVRRYLQGGQDPKLQVAARGCSEDSS